jgi:sulfofructose kinase
LRDEGPGSALREPLVICVGHAALDRVYSVESWPAGSGKIPVRHYDEGGGGMAANAAASIAKLGGRVAFWGPTGDDAVAAGIRARLIADGVAADDLRAFPGTTSSHSAVIVDARGERLVVGYRGTALQAPADWLPLQKIASAGAVLSDVRWVAGAEAALRAARAAGKPAILDAEIADVSILERLARLADHVLFSERGLQAWSPGSIEGGLHAAIGLGARVAAVTRGASGVDWIEAAARARLHHLDAHRVAVVDTLAAGDVFHGAYALVVAEGGTVAQAMRFASAAAAIKCTRPGGRKGAPTRGEVEAFLENAVGRDA